MTEVQDSKPHILVVDDDRLVLATLVNGLTDAGFNVTETDNGEDAIALASEVDPDIALLDMRMNGLSGMDVARHLKAHTRVPFMFLSAFGDPEIVSEATALGALGYLVKPLEIKQIVPAIRAALGRAADRPAGASVPAQALPSHAGDLELAAGLVAQRHGIAPVAARAHRGACRRDRRAGRAARGAFGGGGPAARFDRPLTEAVRCVVRLMAGVARCGTAATRRVDARSGRSPCGARVPLFLLQFSSALPITRMRRPPCGGALEPSKEIPMPQQSRANDECVLLVDDDPVARALTAAVLGAQHLRVVEVESGKAALDCFETVRPDCVVLDAVMPGLDGFDTCLALRRLPHGRHVPVLMLTGLDDERSIEHAYEAGATDFFVKSQQWMLLAHRVRYLLRSARLHTELERSRSRLAKAQALARLGSWDWNLRTEKLQASREVFRMLGLPERDGYIEPSRFLARLHSDDLVPMRGMIERICATRQPQQVELRLLREDGGIVHVQCEGEVDAEEDDAVVRISGTCLDITQRKEAEQRVRALAEFDALTGLPNRRLFNMRIAESIARQGPGGHVALLFMDLDRFKNVNDTQGHTGGDALLVEVAHRLVEVLRQHDADHRADHLVARLGGDEFVVLLQGEAGAAMAEQVGAEILESLRQPFVIHGVENFVTGCMGLARYPEDGKTAESLLRCADAAMYAVKGAGGDALRAFSPELIAERVRRWEIENDLHKALERNELMLHYQPQIDVRSGLVVSAEALMRWNRRGEPISPAQFIPVAQDSGLIIPMGEWAIRETAMQIRRWRDAGLGQMRVAVNVPSMHFQRADLCRTVREACHEADIRPDLIELEITESMLMQDMSRTVDALIELTELGVKLACDDFGTGYSSLAYLRRFPLDALKIDRSFVHDLRNGSDAEAIIEAIIAMARTLHLKVIAEGVETAEQAGLLYRVGCHVMQGFLFGRPQPAEEFAALLARQQRDGGLPEWAQLPRTAVPSLPRLPRSKALQ
ncbi:EAL domain-containing response regulator [Derxia gummosa]|uniref:EAL domain-containing response regulator n=1 Tax=Derxia gummosa DSM 723 TaxID=1121388 RepID=A0A8B6XA72_9BURK|nr:EAL domain-containing protein [Derxia gummosa]